MIPVCEVCLSLSHFSRFLARIPLYDYRDDHMISTLRCEVCAQSRLHPSEACSGGAGQAAALEPSGPCF